jgi:hypothetical protein
VRCEGVGCSGGEGVAGAVLGFVPVGFEIGGCGKGGIGSMVFGVVGCIVGGNWIFGGTDGSDVGGIGGVVIGGFSGGTGVSEVGFSGIGGGLVTTIPFSNLRKFF